MQHIESTSIQDVLACEPSSAITLHNYCQLCNVIADEGSQAETSSCTYNMAYLKAKQQANQVHTTYSETQGRQYSSTSDNFICSGIHIQCKMLAGQMRSCAKNLIYTALVHPYSEGSLSEVYQTASSSYHHKSYPIQKGLSLLKKCSLVQFHFQPDKTNSLKMS